MRKSDFTYDLPTQLIAQYPAAERSASRLLVLERGTGALQDRHFTELPSLLRPGDLLVFNDTRVLPARILGRKASGGSLELMLERVLDSQRLLAQLRASKSPKAGQRLLFQDGVEMEVLGRQQDLYELRLLGERPLLEVLQLIGHMPLPPYIERPDQELDRERYQTIYARQAGAVAAPTAGLHFDQQLFTQLEAMGVSQAFVTLHVGAGTFQPMRVERLAEHVMHQEYLQVTAEVAAAVQRTRAAGGRVIAVGTTTVRALETAAQATGQVRAYQGETEIFIYPGFRFHAIDGLLTNFHLPESTLLMLVCAFAGTEPVLAAYRHAVAQRYRFFSYGDAMFIAPAVIKQ